MRSGTVVGALLVFVGVVALSVGGFSFTSREKVATPHQAHERNE
jgi:hypothetical protein